jgi:hypothetical protein
MKLDGFRISDSQKENARVALEKTDSLKMTSSGSIARRVTCQAEKLCTLYTSLLVSGVCMTG